LRVFDSELSGNFKCIEDWKRVYQISSWGFENGHSQPQLV
jgi:hypothetical protein